MDLAQAPRPRGLPATGRARAADQRVLRGALLPSPLRQRRRRGRPAPAAHHRARSGPDPFDPRAARSVGAGPGDRSEASVRPHREPPAPARRRGRAARLARGGQDAARAVPEAGPRPLAPLRRRSSSRTRITLRPAPASLCTGELVSMLLDGTGRISLTTGPSNSFNADWGPN